jgi:uncharacterized protein YidB (DUF937 family)
MAKAYPSMLALLGLVAVAGYQHRDKIGEFLGNRGAKNPDGSPDPRNQGRDLGSVLGNIRDSIGSGGAGSLLSNGLRELVDRFKNNGREDVAQSWVNRGPNKPIAPDELRATIGSDALATLSRQTGLSEDELLARLSRELPDAVDKYTPDGTLPAA